ncbi:uncharacterized protein NFIA_004190 [Aspergillus fischeri NRRL 181]|uniref:Uncharacterized protein n=1 Tax=Neosartorya fischeri (strain ATCC 1020 / DSM 3700 / CBS 544.65 / FGSC A1164 / JCM 1740 / NRRL 181 / WB 181) TaxID=331117 RepID=A1DK24_NEOFI|nr:uncharacterized protein NFIA_004190 [Aspergillus fischeri NRRL 181]EAW17063.1 hypothetical protein NFIA_004190 [Aspergillus fischeri NRRL 181]
MRGRGVSVTSPPTGGGSNSHGRGRGASIAIQISVSVAVGITTDFVTSVTYNLATSNEIEWGELGITLGLSVLASLTLGVGDKLVKATAKPAQQVIKGTAKGTVKKSFTKSFASVAKNLPKDVIFATSSWRVTSKIQNPIMDALASSSSAGRTASHASP